MYLPHDSHPGPILLFVYSFRKLLWSIYSIPGMIQDIMLWEQCKNQDRHSLCPQVACSLFGVHTSGGFNQCLLVWISKVEGQIGSAQCPVSNTELGLICCSWSHKSQVFTNGLITTLAESLYPRDWG